MKSMNVTHAKFDPLVWMSLFRRYRDRDDRSNPRYLPMVRGPLDACDLLSARQSATSINTAGRESPADVFIWRLATSTKLWTEIIVSNRRARVPKT